jgi:PKD repeat protein
MKTRIYLYALLAIGMLSIAISCDDNESINMAAPTAEDAAFTFEFDTQNPNKVHFTSTTQIDAWYTHWSLGDNSSAEGFETSKVYLKKGDYDVRFKVFTKGGTAESTQTVVINKDFEGPNIIQNGEFNGSDNWNILPISDGVDVTFDGSNAVWSGGSGGHAGIYQAVHVEANTPYQIDMEIASNGMSDSWYEVYIGASIPAAGQDYNDGGIRLGLNTWNGCGTEPFDGLFTEISCAGEGNGLVEFNTSGTVYLVIRGGGFGTTTDVTLDNVSLSPLDAGVIVMPPKFPPIANFSIAKSNLTATFTNTTKFGESYIWDFGDGVGTSEEENPTYTYAEEGTYTVQLTATNTDGSDDYLKDVSFGESSNLITNGTFSDDSGWTIINIDATDNGVGSVSIANGVVKFSETATDPWKHWAIYTAVTLEAGTYQFDMDMTYAGINDSWGEVYIGATQPTDNSGQDYNGDQQVLKAYNAWECGNKTYDGSAIEGGCDTNANPGQFEITSAGTYYLLFRTGGSRWGSEGIILDNWSLLKI